MKLNIVIALLLVASGIFAQEGNSRETFNKPGFYAVVSSTNLDSVNAMIALVKNSALTSKDGYEGVLLMKKAGLVGNPGNKLNLFRSGHKKLESSIKKESKNAELRVLRLMIQENAPRLLNYKDDIAGDREIIYASFKTMPSVVQKFIAEYSKKSKVLNPASL